eukprot:12951169-Heterocapsa_arctica.AAC.1
MKEGLGDKVEKKAGFEAISKPMKEVLGDKGETILDSGRGENKEYGECEGPHYGDPMSGAALARLCLHFL